MAPLSNTKGEKGEGDAVFTAWESRRRNPPFLRRNLRQAIEALVVKSKRAKPAHRMGTVLSRFKAARPREVEDEEDDDEPPRVAKRRKTGHPTIEETQCPSFQPVSKPVESTITTKQRSLPPENGCSTPFSTSPFNFKIDSILPKGSQKALRIDVLGVDHDDIDVAETTLNSTPKESYSCRCFIAVFAMENENDPELSELFRYSKPGTLYTSHRNGKYHADLSLPGPFIISAEELYVNRRNDHYLGDTYRLHVWLKSSNPRQNWPPMEVAPCIVSTELGGILKEVNASLNDLWLFGTTKTMLDPGQQDMNLEMNLGYGTRNRRTEKVKTPYHIRVGINWSLPSTLNSLHPKHQKPKPTAKSFGQCKDLGTIPIEVEQENIPIPETESPQRTRRRREDIPNYNLKVLSDIARGDQPRASLRRDSRSGLGAADHEDTTVTYSLGRADAADLGVPQKAVISGLRCPFCNHDQGSLEKLKIHLRSQHSYFKFSLRRSHAPRVQFFVEFAGKFGKFEQARTMELLKPVTVFDIGKFLEEDRSWEISRQGPQHDKWPPHMADRFQSSSISASPSNSRTSSPNTSIDEMFDHVGKETSFKSSLVSRPSLANKSKSKTIANGNTFRRPQKLRVPRTARQLYHPITKRHLAPGELIDNSDDENDESWLNQKHRDIIMDYTNITDSEKDYVIRWNPFITLLKLTCDMYMPQVVVRFIAENKLWFLCEETRITEFCKHAEALMLRGTIASDCWMECMEILKSAAEETSKEDIQKAKQAEPVIWDPTKQRGYMDCICGLPVNPIDALNQIKCTGVACDDPHFHPQCVKEVVIDENGLISNYDELRTWKCAACANTNGENKVQIYAGTLFLE